MENPAGLTSALEAINRHLDRMGQWRGPSAAIRRLTRFATFGNSAGWLPSFKRQ
jgi:hypothetical protein